MSQGRTVFFHLPGFLPDRFRGFSCRDQCLAMPFAQMNYRDRVRDIDARLRSPGGKLYHTDSRGRVSRSTLADADNAHDWRMCAGFAQVLIRIHPVAGRQ